MSIFHPDHLQRRGLPWWHHPLVRFTIGPDTGQATAEYGLVMLAAAAIAGLLLAWASSTDAVGRIMDAVVASIIGDIR